MRIIFGILLIPHLAWAWTLSASGLMGWKTKNLVINWSSSNCSISSTELTDTIDKAIDVWNRNPTTNITLSRNPSETSMTVAAFLAGNATPMPVILCDHQLSTNNPGVDPDGVPGLTHLTTYAPITYGGILLNTEPGAAADINNFSETENVIILAHELGHLLGLGHSSDTKALMYYSLDGKTSAVLARDDRDGMAYLYPRNEFQGGFYGCTAVHRREAFGPAGWSYVAMMLLMAGLSFGARRLFYAFSRVQKI